MNRFNFVPHRNRGWAERFHEFGVDRSLQRTLSVFIAATMLAIAGAAIEQLRLHSATSRATFLTDRLRSAEGRLQMLHNDVSTVHHLAATADEVSRIQRSGAFLARGLAEMGDLLPNNARLISIRYDEQGVTLVGIAENYATVGFTMRSLAGAETVVAPQLIRASLEGGADPHVVYEIRAQWRQL